MSQCSHVYNYTCACLVLFDKIAILSLCVFCGVGASAAYAYIKYGEWGDSGKEKCTNTLVAHCPAFCSEVGEDRSGSEGVVAMLRETLSQEKKMRLCSREKVVLDGHFPDDVEHHSKEASSDVFTVQRGLTYPFEFIDYGACFYRKYFYEKGVFHFSFSLCVHVCVWG